MTAPPKTTGGKGEMSSLRYWIGQRTREFAHFVAPGQ
jgi:hypothetical protein